MQVGSWNNRIMVTRTEITWGTPDRKFICQPTSRVVRPRDRRSETTPVDATNLKPPIQNPNSFVCANFGPVLNILWSKSNIWASFLKKLQCQRPLAQDINPNSFVCANFGPVPNILWSKSNIWASFLKKVQCQRPLAQHWPMGPF
jgi:hypothetical protein